MRALLIMAFTATWPVLASAPSRAADPVRVVVWDEQQPAQKKAYTNYLGNEIAEHLRQAGVVGAFRQARRPQAGFGRRCS